MQVYKGILFKEDIAIKVVLQGGRKEQSRFLNEIKTLYYLNSKHITRFMGYSVAPDGLLLLMEYVAGMKSLPA